MPVTVGVNSMSVVHAGSNGVSIAFPDVCKTPAPPAPFVPIPYPNIAKSADTSKGAKQVTCDGNPPCIKDSNFMMSTGDEAGTLLGMISSKIKGKAEFINFSFDVQIEGKNVPRAMDMMLALAVDVPACVGRPRLHTRPNRCHLLVALCGGVCVAGPCRCSILSRSNRATRHHLGELPQCHHF